MFYSYKEETIDYDIVYSNRKSVELKVLPIGKLVLKCPKGIKESDIESIIESRWDWILKGLEKMTSDLNLRQYVSGEVFTILGKELTLVVHRQSVSTCKIKQVKNELVIQAPKAFTLEDFQNVMMTYLKAILKPYLEKRIKFYQHRFAQKVNNITVRNQKTRWGSCSSGRNISFNYRLALAPIAVIDYIILHEMSHLEHMNHSKSFWKKVYDVMPDYETHEKYLKQYGHLLSVVVYD